MCARIVITALDHARTQGTSGETMNLYRHLFPRIEQKLAIVMNKMDTFESPHDLTRGFGTLYARCHCWQVSYRLNELRSIYA